MSASIEWERAALVWEATPKVIAAWSFGSGQHGRVGPGSDVDIGVLMESPPSLDERFELLARLQAALHFEDIDLVILNGANPILRFEAISGRPLFCRDADRRAEFASLTAREYEDEMAFWQRSIRSRP
ncbi:MAG: nucleotidyltransferase domain-containing protein [Anaerolineae bacterium]